MHEAIFSDGIQLRGQGLSEAEVRMALHERLEDWHNGVSRTYNRSPAEAHAEVDRIVTDLFAVRRQRREWVPLPGLSTTEIRAIVDATRSASVLVDPQTGHSLGKSPEASRFKLQLFLFHVCNLAKQFVLTELRDAHAATGSAFANRAVWPDLSVPAFIVPRPRGLVDRMPGISRPAYPALKRAAAATGLVVPARGPNALVHRAATYWVRLEFGALSRPRLLFPSLTSGLARVLSAGEFPTLYTRHHAGVIRRAGALPAALPPAIEPYEQLLCDAIAAGAAAPCAGDELAGAVRQPA